MSVCEGAFKLAQAGLLDDKSATTHHAASSALANQYPASRVHSSVRYVQSDPLILTAGGLSSGIDSALHVSSSTTAKVAQAAAATWNTKAGWEDECRSGQPTQVQPTIRSPTETGDALAGHVHPAYPKPEPELPLVLHLAQVEGSTGQPSMCRASRRWSTP